MIVHQIITSVYWLIIGFFGLLLVVKIVRSREFDRQFLAAFVLVPFLLRLFSIK